MTRAVRRALSAGSLAAVVMLFGLWWVFVRAPPPQVVCDHIIEVTLRESQQVQLAPESQAAVIEQQSAHCMKNKANKIQLRGRVVWARYAKCVLAGETIDEIWRC